MAEYSGSDWIERQLKCDNPHIQMSQLGQDVADLLGELYCGIYHLDLKQLFKVDWTNKYYIEISIGWKPFATVDYDELTRLVFLAHHRAIRVELSAATHKYIHLIFHQRKRIGDYAHRHPTLDEAVDDFKKHVSLPEFQDH